ncbi:MAG: glycosyltransferase family 4 protein [bacterium]
MKTKLRIAIYHNLPSGGAKRTLYEIVKRLSKKHHIDLYSLSCANNEYCDIRPFIQNFYIFPFSAIQEFKSPFGRLNYLCRIITLIYLDSLAKKIARLINERKYDLAFVQPCQFTQAPLILRYLKIKTVYHCHEPLRWVYDHKINNNHKVPKWRKMARDIFDKFDIFRCLYQYMYKKNDFTSTRKSTKVIVVSNFIKEKVQRIYKIQPELVYNGIDVNKFSLPENIMEKDNYVLSVGALSPVKGFQFIIETLSLIPLEKRPKLVIVSNTENLQEQLRLQNLAEKRSVKVIIYKKIDDEQLIKLYQRAKITVYAPVEEPFGLVPLESMSCGTSVIGIREGGVCESVIHQKTGLLTDRVTENYAKAVQFLLENKEVARRYDKQGREYVVENWSWEKSVSNLEKYFYNVVDDTN